MLKLYYKSGGDLMFADRLRLLREAAGLSQSDLAKQVFVAQQSVGKWEKNLTKPSPEMYVKLARIFNVTTDYLLGLTDIPQAGTNASYSAEESALLDSYRRLSGRGREYIQQQMAIALTLYTKKSNVNFVVETAE